MAEVAQRVLLRPVPRRAGHLRAAVSYTSAMAEARIGGDLYEVVTGPSGVRVIVGDVQGKGLEAVETSAPRSAWPRSELRVRRPTRSPSGQVIRSCCTPTA